MTMKKLYFILITYFGAFTISFGQSLDISIEIAPPYPVELDYYLENADNLFITMTNKLNTSQDVYYQVRLTGDNGIDLHTFPSYKPGSPVTFQPFETKMYTGTNMSMDFPFSYPDDIDISSLTQEQYDFITFYRSLPEGTYELCVRALDYTTDVPISVGCSASFQVLYADAPYIYMPANGEEVIATENSLVNIGWEPPFVSNPGIANFEYTLEIVDITNDPFGDIELLFANPGTYEVLYKENLLTPIYNYTFHQKISS